MSKSTASTHSESKPKGTWVKCPHCQTAVLYSMQNNWRPFCSQHCYNLDLGAWASENYRIASKPSPEDDPTE